MFVRLDEARGRNVLVALSGGADSVALLKILCDARDQGILNVMAAHFEHGIRGAESLADADFCRSLCAELDVLYIPGRADVPEIARRTGEGLETCARNLRHRFLNETADMFGCDFIALAHHMDDQAETVLMHILRGSGTDGACGMRRLSGRLYRPLLDVRKSEIIEYLRAEGLEWREDSTNRISDNPRNALRLEAIPAIERVYPAGVRALARYARNIAIENELISRLADEFYESRVEKLPHGWRIDMSGKCEEALLRRALRRICGPDLTSAKLNELVALDSACDVFGGMRAEKCGDRLYVTGRFETAHAAALLKLNGLTELEGLCRISCSPAPAVPEKVLKSTQVLRRGALEGAVLRTRIEGDRIAPFGMNGAKSLSDYMTDLKIDRPMRDLVPVIARGHDVLWVVGYGISRECAIDGCDAVKLECQYTGWGGFNP